MQTVTDRKWHYVYYSYELGGRGYIGKRSSSVPPDQDPYLGSFTDKTFKPTHKIIIALFNSPEEAIRSEIALHHLFRVDTSEHFANKVIQPSPEFFNRGGYVRSKRKVKTKEASSPRFYGPTIGLPASEVEEWHRLIQIIKKQRGKYMPEEYEDMILTTYPLRGPTGTVFPVTDVWVFCQTCKLDPWEIEKVLMGEIESHRGWTRVNCYV